MRVLYVPPSQAAYSSMFRAQSGQGTYTPFAGFRHQRGRGIGSFLGSIVRGVLPKVGREVLRAGLGTGLDVLAGQPWKPALEARSRLGARRLLKKGITKLDTLNGNNNTNAPAVLGAGTTKRKRRHNRKKRQQKGRGVGVRGRKKTLAYKRAQRLHAALGRVKKRTIKRKKLVIDRLGQ